VKPNQKPFIDAILNYPGHIIAAMRSKTEWVTGGGKNGRPVHEKPGPAPGQGKGVEYEFDLLVELNQRHEGIVTKDRTGIDRPGEEFGVSLYDRLNGGNAAAPATPARENPPSVKAAKTDTGAKPETGTPAPPRGNTLKEQGDTVMREIGKIITTAAREGAPYFTGDEKEEARQIIRETRLDDVRASEQNPNCRRMQAVRQ
jgi:hypothetical protein